MGPRKYVPYAVGILFFVSGFSGLVYEVLWTRSLTLVFGNTVIATSTVLAAYMGGLAIGAYAVGRLADRLNRPLLLYAFLEAIVGCAAVAFPLVERAIIPVLQDLYRGHHGAALGWFRFLCAFLFLIIPTAAMGGTLPALARLLARIETAGRTLAYLYGINTLGATLGTVAAGFFLLPRWGLSGTMAAAVALNAAVAVVATFLSLAPRRDEERVPAEAKPQQPIQPSPMTVRYKIVLGAFLVSGALALALEVLWTRSLLLVFGSTVYSFTTMLAVFLVGLALGSGVVGLFVDRLPYRLAALGLVEAGIGLVTLVSIARVNLLPAAFLDGLMANGFTWDTYLMQKVLIAAGILFPAAFLFGATFPIVARIEVFRERRIGGQVGLIYAFNTVGAIAGSLLAGFVLLPALGLRASLTVVALLALGLGAVLIMSEEKRAKLWIRIPASLLLLIVGTGIVIRTPPWNEKLLSAGVYFRPKAYLSPDGKHNIMDQVLGDLKVLDFVEGVTETAAVVQTPISRMFIVDGKVEAATDIVDMRLQRLQGILPMLFAPRYGKALNIGLGCGITLGGLKLFPLKSFQCVELEKKIVGTARYFAKQNEDVLDDPRLAIIINDGRNHLLLTDQKYDVITSDPFEPLVGGAASLYTENHFRIASRRLTPGGIFCQYLPMYQLFPRDYRMIIRSFCRVYPHVALWYTGIDTILLGSDRPLELDFSTLERRMKIPAVKTALEGIGISDPLELLQTFVMDPSRLLQIKADGRLNTDTHPYIEFDAPRSHLANTTPRNLKWLLANYRPQDLPVRFSDDRDRQVEQKARRIGKLVMEGALARFEGRYEDALKTVRQAEAIDPKNGAVLFEISADANQLAAGLMNLGRFDEAKPLLDEALRTGQEPLGTLMNLATWAFRTGRTQQALDYTKQALDLNPNVPDSNLKMALCLERLGKTKEALSWVEKALTINPLFLQARLTRADLALALGNKAEALKLYEAILPKYGDRVTGQDWLTYGFLLAERSRWRDARRAFQRAAELNPTDPRAWYNLARVAKLEGDTSASRAALKRAMAIAPEAVRRWLASDPILGRPQKAQ